MVRFPSLSLACGSGLSSSGKETKLGVVRGRTFTGVEQGSVWEKFGSNHEVSKVRQPVSKQTLFDGDGRRWNQLDSNLNRTKSCILLLMQKVDLLNPTRRRLEDKDNTLIGWTDKSKINPAHLAPFNEAGFGSKANKQREFSSNQMIDRSNRSQNRLMEPMNEKGRS